MFTRREFIQTAAGAVGVAAAHPAFAAAVEGQTARGIVTRVVFDQRQAVTSAFGATVQNAAIATEGFTGDISSFWRTVLQG